MSGSNGSAPAGECYPGCRECARARYSCQRCRLYVAGGGCPVYEGCRAGRSLGAVPEHFQAIAGEPEAGPIAAPGLASASVPPAAKSPAGRTISAPAKSLYVEGISEPVSAPEKPTRAGNPVQVQAPPEAKRGVDAPISAPAKTSTDRQFSEAVSARVIPAGRCQNCGGLLLQAEVDPAEAWRCLTCGRPAVPARSAAEAGVLTEGRPAVLPGRTRKAAREGPG